MFNAPSWDYDKKTTLDGRKRDTVIKRNKPEATKFQYQKNINGFELERCCAKL